MIGTEKLPTTETSSSVVKQPLAEYGLDGVDCPICGNTGQIHYKKDGYDYCRDCECMPKRRSIRELNRSGLQSLSELYTFDKYVPDNPRSEALLMLAKKYVDDDPAWFFVCGRPGSGKSHICCSICLALIERGAQVVYMMWRDEVVKLKSALVENPDYYQRRMEQLKKAQTLYIDDLFKGHVSEADKKLAFELLNYRYNQPLTRTLISTELDFKALQQIDEALARRIYERSEGYRRRSPDKNYSYENRAKL